MPNLLSIETSSVSCSVCIKTDEGLSKLYQNKISNIHGEVIFEFIESALNEVRKKKEDLDFIIFGSGPGSFTGLRVGCSVAQGLGYGLKVPIIPISSLRILAQQAINDLDAKKVIVINDAHMEELYIGEYILSENITIPSKPDFSILKEDIGELALAATKDFFFIGNAVNLLDTKLKGRIFPDLIPTANSSFSLAEDLISKGKFISAEKVKINYLSGESQWKRA